MKLGRSVFFCKLEEIRQKNEGKVEDDVSADPDNLDFIYSKI